MAIRTRVHHLTIHAELARLILCVVYIGVRSCMILENLPNQTKFTFRFLCGSALVDGLNHKYVYTHARVLTLYKLAIVGRVCLATGA